MAKQLQMRRGTTAQHQRFTGAAGELTVNTDTNTKIIIPTTTNILANIILLRSSSPPLNFFVRLIFEFLLRYDFLRLILEFLLRYGFLRLTLEFLLLFFFNIDNFFLLFFVIDL